MLVDHAPHIPCACCICTNQTGPFADTFFEDRAGRKYVCKRCAKSVARLFGFAPGERMDELSEAASLVEGKDREIEAAQDLIRELNAQLEEGKRAAAGVEDELELALERERTREHLIESLVQTALQLRGVREPVPA